MRALGVDVGGVRKGLDLVVLDDTIAVLDGVRHATVADLSDAIERWKPHVIAIDSPPSFALGRPRPTEVAIRKLGLSLYATPWEEEEKANPFYAWMHSGFAAFSSAASAGYELCVGDGPVAGKAIEVFPYATAVVLTRRLRPRDLTMHAWRRRLLGNLAIDDQSLRGPDQVDAALAAFTGLRALAGIFCMPGGSSDGGIALPCLRDDLPLRFV